MSVPYCLELLPPLDAPSLQFVLGTAGIICCHHGCPSEAQIQNSSLSQGSWELLLCHGMKKLEKRLGLYLRDESICHQPMERDADSFWEVGWGRDEGYLLLGGSHRKTSV